MQLKQVMQQLKVLLWILMVELATSTALDNFIFTNGFKGTKFRLDGIASITENGILRLTNDTEQSTGHAIYPTPFHFLRPSTGKAVSFSTTFVFAMIPQDPEYYGHGMAFFLSPTMNFSTAMASQCLGLFNVGDNGDSSNHIVAVELDTILNMEYDNDSNHLGIDINGLKSNLSHYAGYFDDRTGEFHNLSLVSGEPMQVWVDYDGGEMKLDVTIAPIQMVKPKRPLLSLVVNLSSILLDPMYIGFASSTGTVVASHNLLGWSFKMNGPAKALDLSALPLVQEVVLNEKGKQRHLKTWLPVVMSIVLLIGIAVAIIFMLRRIKTSKQLEDWELQCGPHRFSYNTLIVATNAFHDKLILGVGGFGRVYKGVLPKCNTEIAVKKVSPESNQGITEFVSEITTLGQLRHRNLVQLLGYCRHKGELLLVYEYMHNGSLDKFLYHQDRTALNWAQRFHIIKGVASGIEYLHQNWAKAVIHRDIKTSNVLLDRGLNGRLGDFGLARLCDHNTDPPTTTVAGTLGYIAPELPRTGRPTTLTDVFAFGVLILEVACGRRAINPNKEEEANQVILMDWVAENWQKGTILDTIDSRLEEEGYFVNEVELVLKLGLLCSHPLPASRPTMRQVVQYLNGDAPLPPLSLAYLSFRILALQQNAGIDQYLSSATTDSFVQSGDCPSEVIAEPYSDEGFLCRVPIDDH